MTPQYRSIAFYKLPVTPYAQSPYLCYHTLTGSTATDIFETPPTPTATYHWAFSHLSGHHNPIDIITPPNQLKKQEPGYPWKNVSYDLGSFRD